MMDADRTLISFTILYSDIWRLLVPALVFWTGYSILKLWIIDTSHGWSILNPYVIVGWIYFGSWAVFYYRHDDVYRYVISIFVVLPLLGEVTGMVGRAWRSMSCRWGMWRFGRKWKKHLAKEAAAKR